MKPYYNRSHGIKLRRIINYRASQGVSLPSRDRSNALIKFLTKPIDPYIHNNTIILVTELKFKTLLQTFDPKYISTTFSHNRGQAFSFWKYTLPLLYNTLSKLWNIITWNNSLKQCLPTADNDIFSVCDHDDKNCDKRY